MQLRRKAEQGYSFTPRFCCSLMMRGQIRRHFREEELSHGSKAFQHLLFVVQAYGVLFVTLTDVFFSFFIVVEEPFQLGRH